MTGEFVSDSVVKQPGSVSLATFLGRADLFAIGPIQRPARSTARQCFAISVGADFEKLAPQEKTKGARDVRGPSGPTGLRYLNRRRCWLSVADLAG
jgi:hypothetical protein